MAANSGSFIRFSATPDSSEAKRPTAAATSAPPGLRTLRASPQGVYPIAPLRQVIERAQQQHGIHATVAFVEPPRVAQPAGGQRGLGLARRGRARLFDVERRGIDERHAIAS